MVLTESPSVALADDTDASARHFNSIPLDELVADRGVLIHAFIETRAATLALAKPLTTAQQCIQSMADASPVKWHLAHTTWFFETFLLQRYEHGFKWIDEDYCYLFNSYYNSIGQQYPRSQRGEMEKPGVADITTYRSAVDQRMLQLLNTADDNVFGEFSALLLLGLNHEQQHQELILTDFQHAWSLNPGISAPWPQAARSSPSVEPGWLEFEGGLVNTGHSGPCFSFDNEGPRHKYWLESYSLANRPVSNGDYLDFITDGGYANPLLWLSDGWNWIQQNDIHCPIYWFHGDGQWQQCNIAGMQSLNPGQPMANVNFYEASAYANWSIARLPTEYEWEYAMASSGMASYSQSQIQNSMKLPQWIQVETSGMWLGNAWEWTASPYVAYPRFRPGAGAIGEYNAKFMSSQVVLRGYSGFTATGHSRVTYRNFFYPGARWQQSGFRLARDSGR